jgi:gliding motility-associated-like protein
VKKSFFIFFNFLFFIGFSQTTQISQTKIALDNSSVSVTFSDAVYGGSGNSTSTLEVSDFELSISGGSASLSSSTPSSIIVSGTTIGLGIPLSGTPDGDEILTILPVSNAVFSVSGETVSTTQSNNTTELVPDIVTDDVVLYLDASNTSSYPGTGTVWHDLSPNQNDGLISGTTFSSNGGEGFIFGGSSSDYITVADDTSLDMDNNQMTISYEITPDLNGSNWSPAIQKGVSASACGVGTLNYYTWYGNNDFKIDFEGNSNLRGQLYNATSEDISNGKKIMITITVDQSNVVKTFINGELKHSLNNSGQVLGSSTNGPLVIGYCPDPSGKISSIMIYDRALTSQEVFQNYDALNDIPPTDISLTSNTITETASIGSLVGVLSATDSDTSSNNLSFSFASSGDTQDDDNGSFTISGTSLLTSSTLDYETKTSYSIYINVNDGANNYAKAFTVSVTNVNEAPTDLSFEAPDVNVEYLVVGGGGGGGGGDVGAGGGAGGFRTNKTGSQSGGGCAAEPPMVVTVGTYPVLVGAGGNGGISTSGWASDGGDSSFNGIISTGGGGAPGWRATNGRAGGSGSGSTGQGGNNPGSGASCQGYNGGTGLGAGNYPQGGGGGAGGLGENAPNQNQAGAGGPGLPNPFQNSNIGQLSGGQRYLAGGGGGGVESNAIVGNGGVGGGGIGGRQIPNLDPGNGLPNTGGGGGGEDNQTGGSGGSGVVILRYLGNPIATGGTITQSGEYTLHTFTQVGNSNLIVSSGGTSTSTASFDEGSAVGTVVTSLTAADSDTTNLTYSLATGNGTTDQHNSLFTVSGTQLLVASSTISYDTTTSLNVNLGVSDGQNTFTKAFQISVNDVNRAPTDIGLTSNTITENGSPSTVVGTLSSVDSDTTDTTSYTLATSGDAQDDDNGSFTISGTSLILNSSPDYETKTSYSIYINANDGANNYAKAFTVSVTNILEPITDLGFHISKAYKFNGTNNYIEVPYVAENHPSNFTIELWARLDQDTGTWQSPLSSRYGAAPWNNLSGYNFYAVNGLGSWSFSTGSGVAWEGLGTSTSTIGEIYNGTTLKFGIWTHLASTYDGTTIRFYVNGTLVGTDSAGYSRVGFNSIPQRPLRIGAGRTEGSATYFFDGAVDEVRIWNYVRTRNEINNNKNAVLSGQETGLVSYYSFDNGNASNETGVSARDGTLYNSPTIITRNTPYQANIDEESSLGTIVGTLTATDSDTTSFTFSLESGNGTNDQHNSLFTISGNQLLVAGNIDYETNSSLNIYVQASDGSNTFAKALTVNVNDINEPPVITATTLSNDNGSINVTFSEPVFISADASNTLPLEVSDFALSISGGTATLSSTTPSSISVNGNIYTLGLTLSGIPDGNETLTVVPIQDAIYDAGAATASTTQSNNMVSLHGDGDSDGVNDALDQCPNTPGGASVDVNGCADSQKDPDNDGISGMNDNCPNTANSNQTDTDGDGLGDACDPDIDNDGIANSSDNCPYDYNPDQKDTDTDGMGDLCDRDNDNDGYDDGADRFPFDPTEWFDSDNDGIGNNADTDDDNDTYLDTDDAFPLDRKEWLDSDGDGIGNNKDTDDDNDGVEDREDDLPLDPNEYLDTDKDGIGNNLDDDDDDDGYSDLDEIACNTDPLKRSSRPEDYDRDLSPDCIDTDDDNDGCLDQEDLFPFNERECIDTDGDGIGDNADMDADNDGIIDSLDDFPTDPNESKDTDGDGIGDNADLDDNNDGFPEDPITNSAGEEVIPIFVSELLTPNQSGEESTWRIVNIDRYPSANVKVYSPSGLIVFESWNYQNDWNGTNKDGKTLPTGPYFYRIDRGNETTVEEGWLYIFN